MEKSVSGKANMTWFVPKVTSFDPTRRFYQSNKRTSKFLIFYTVSFLLSDFYYFYFNLVHQNLLLVNCGFMPPGKNNKICWTYWELYMVLFSFLEQSIKILYSLLLLLRERFSTVKGLQGCIHLYHMLLPRYIWLCKWFQKSVRLFERDWCFLLCAEN